MIKFPHKLVQEKVDWYLWKQRMSNNNKKIERCCFNNEEENESSNFLLNSVWRQEGTRVVYGKYLLSPYAEHQTIEELIFDSVDEVIRDMEDIQKRILEKWRLNGNKVDWYSLRNDGIYHHILKDEMTLRINKIKVNNI